MQTGCFEINSNCCEVAEGEAWQNVESKSGQWQE
jgi:hypothetical protein